MNVKTWQGDEDRPVEFYRPCGCGCDERGGAKGAGYLSGSDAEGNGFTVWMTEAEWARFVEQVAGVRA